MINKGISLSNRTYSRLMHEFVEVMCLFKNVDYNQYTFPTVCPANGFDIAGFPRIEIYLDDGTYLFELENRDYFIFPIALNRTTPTEANFGVSHYGEYTG